MATVLVVDDEDDIRELLVDTLLDSGFQVIEAPNGVEALMRASRDRPDILLLDIWMPGMDGYEVLWRLKEESHTQNIPVVLLTAMPASDGEVDGMSLGVNHYVSKPWDTGEIEAVIRVALAEAGISLNRYDDEPEKGGDGLSLDTGSVDMKTKDAKIFTMQGGLARLRRSRKKKPAADGEEEKEVVRTGEKLLALEHAMGGGLPTGSVCLVVGAASCGKSVLCQHLTYGALEGGYGAAFFTSEHTAASLVSQMASIGLDVSQYVRRDKLLIYGVPEPEEGEEAEPLLGALGQSIERLSRGAQFIAIDAITDLAGSSSQQAVIAFFTNCRRLSNQGRTLFISVHSYAFGPEMFHRLRDLCDGYMTLGSEQLRGKQVRTLEVNKIGTTELNKNNTVSFVVEPETGMRVIPLQKTRG